MRPPRFILHFFRPPVHVVTSSASFASPQAARLTRFAVPPLPAEPVSLGFGWGPLIFPGRRLSLFRHTAAQGGVSVGRDRDSPRQAGRHTGAYCGAQRGTRARAAPHRERPLTHSATPSAASRPEQVPAPDAAPATAGCTPLPSGHDQHRRPGARRPQGSGRRRRTAPGSYLGLCLPGAY